MQELAIGEHIFTTRKRLKLSQKNFAQMVGITPMGLRNIEKGVSHPKDETLSKILDCLAACDEHEALETIFDYVRISFPIHDLSRIFNNILRIKEEFFFEKESSLYGYTGAFNLDHIIVLTSPPGNERGSLIQLSGQGCRQFESFLNRSKRTWYDFFKICSKHGANFTRIDVAINDYEHHLSIPALLRKTENTECISKFRDFEFHGGGSLSNKEKRGKTIYFGSKSSDFYLTFYQKDFEVSKKKRIPVEDVPIKNRYELRLSDRRAEEFIQKFMNIGETTSVVLGLLNNYIRFVDEEKGVDREKWKTNKKWDNFLGECGKMRLVTEPTEEFYQKSVEWIRHSASPTIKMIQEVDEINETNEFEEILDEVELKEKYLHLIKIMTSSVNDMLVNDGDKTT